MLFLKPGYWDIGIYTDGCKASWSRLAVVGGHARHAQLSEVDYAERGEHKVPLHPPMGALVGTLAPGQTGVRLLRVDGEVVDLAAIEPDRMFYFDEERAGTYELSIETGRGIVRHRVDILRRAIAFAGGPSM